MGYIEYNEHRRSFVDEDGQRYADESKQQLLDEQWRPIITAKRQACEVVEGSPAAPMAAVNINPAEHDAYRRICDELLRGEGLSLAAFLRELNCDNKTTTRDEYRPVYETVLAEFDESKRYYKQNRWYYGSADGTNTN